MANGRRSLPCMVLILCSVTLSFCATDPNDLEILNGLRKGLENPELLKWPEDSDDPCGPPLWPHIFCTSDNRVGQIQVQGLGLKGPLPQNFNQLSRLSNIGLQRNHFDGKLPSFSGLSELEFAYLDYNGFDTIPSDFFDGLTSIRVLALDYNPLNTTTGWSLPVEFAKSVQLTNLSLVNTSLVGPLPDFLGTLPELTALKLSFNRLSGVIPKSLGESTLQIMWLNDQAGNGMTGSIDVIPSMVSLTQLWLHGNSFTGAIPDGIGSLTLLKDLNVNSNKLVGLVPESLSSMKLDNLDLSNNLLMGPMPKFMSGNVSCDHNSFCQSTPGTECAPEVNALIDFLHGVEYPFDLSSEWSGNNPCDGPWIGLSCNPTSKVDIINLPNRSLNGTLTPSLVKMDSLLEIRLKGNNLSGRVPSNFTQLKSLRLLDLTGNNFEPPLPHFDDSVKIIADGNPLFRQSKGPSSSPSPPPLLTNPPTPTPPPQVNNVQPPLSDSPTKSPSSSLPISPGQLHSPTRGSSTATVPVVNQERQYDIASRKFKVVVIVGGVAALAIFGLLSIIAVMYCCHHKKKKKKGTIDGPNVMVVHPRDPDDPENRVKVVTVSCNSPSNLFTKTATNSPVSRNSTGTTSSHMIEPSKNITISVQILRKVTNNFAPENQLGHGGFGVVYKGEFPDGTKIAVKRMESSGIIINSKALNEFQSEIDVLSNVRHRHLVTLYGYTTEGNEKLLVYEYMPQGALSRHLFHWRSLNLQPLSWMKRVSIALDVARGVEYLHSLAQQSFIHRDLKSSNILLDEEYRAKVSDFGLVKLAPDRETSVATKLAGTFGYLAPEYAVTGKVTTKVDVFSYGVVLMELLTGLMALDDSRSEETRYLAEYFSRIKSNPETLMAAIDPALEIKENGLESMITIIAELAGHCTSRDPNHRPEMGYIVSVLSPIVEKWKPNLNDEKEEYSGIDYKLPLPMMLKGWKKEEGNNNNNKGGTEDVSNGSEDSRGSIPAKPNGFAESFTSSDGR